jgi:hypothetical protein
MEEDLKTEFQGRVGAKAEEGLKVESKERQNLDARPAGTIKVFKLIRRHFFHLETVKRKFALLSALAILSVIALRFGVSAVDKAPVVEPGTAMTQEEKPVPITLIGSDPDGGQLTYNIVRGPSHGSLSGTAPNMTYTPALNYNGPDSFTFSVKDGKVDSDQVMIGITVLAVNDAPTGSDVDGDPLLFIICKEPEYGTLTLDSNFSTNGRFIYTPETNFTGQDIFTFKVNDGDVESALATVFINVAPNLFPVAEPHSVNTVEDTPVEIRLMGSDPDRNSLTYNIVTAPTHGSLKGTAPDLTYTPNSNFYGFDSITFKVNDGAADSSPATVSIMVSPVDDPPVANDDTVMIQEDTLTLTIDVLANDTDIDNVGRYIYLDLFTVTAVDQGANGSVAINPDNTLTYSRHANSHGNDSFTYTISDDKGRTDTAAVNITVNVVSDAPAITSAPVVKAAVSASYSYGVDTTGPNVADTLADLSTTKSANMTTDSTTELIQWQPIQVGDNKVVVKVVDGNGIPALDDQSYRIVANPAPPKIAKLTVIDGYNQRNRRKLSAEGKTNLVRHSDNNRSGTNFGSYVSYDFSDVSIPTDAKITSVVVYVEHFEEERFGEGNLKWSVGAAWPSKPVAWASINAPVREGQSHEAVDSWDVTSIVDTCEKINSLQLQVKNNDNIARRRTLIDYIHAVVKWD